MNTLLLKIIFVPVVLAIASQLSWGQSENAPENIRIVDSKNYIFRAQSASPLKGGSIQLTSDYDLTVTGDSIIAFLPYFGESRTAPMDPSAGGIKFTSTDFEYAVDRRKGSWEIRISLKDQSEVRELFLDLFENGRASLRVSGTHRQPIGFSGYFTERKGLAKKPF